MLDRVTLRQTVRMKLVRWLEQSPYARSEFMKCGEGSAVEVGVHISDPATVSLGSNSMIYRNCTILTGPGHFELGDNSHLAGCVYVNALRAGVYIGRGVAIGPLCVIVSYSNAVQSGKRIADARMWGDVRIGDDVFVGAGSVILPGVTIEDGAVVGAGSVVNRDVNARTVVAGTPARTIRPRP
jgi:acetyltransferase-like isoleucine patch superfamily enzyme